MALAPFQRPTRRPAPGLSLVECLLAIVTLSVVVLGLSYTTTAGHQQARHGEHMLRGVRLAEHLLAEILSKPYADPDGGAGLGPDPGETARADYNDLDDYDGYSEAAGNLRDFAGALYPADEQGFSRAVSVSLTTHTLAALDGMAIEGKTVRVTVTDSQGGQWQIERFIPAP